MTVALAVAACFLAGWLAGFLLGTASLRGPGLALSSRPPEGAVPEAPGEPERDEWPGAGGGGPAPAYHDWTEAELREAFGR